MKSDIQNKIEDLENQIEIINSDIASMEQQLAMHEGEPNRWYNSCEYALTKAELRKEDLEKRLGKQLNMLQQLEMQEQAAFLREEKAEASNLRQIELAEALSAAKRKRVERKHVELLDLSERRFIELRRLLIPLLGEEVVFPLCQKAEEMAKQWQQSRS